MDKEVDIVICDVDVPDLIAALAEHFLLHGIDVENAGIITLEMLADAMAEPSWLH